MANKIKRSGFVTEIDRFMRDFDKKRVELPRSRIEEVRKHQKIFEKRDKPVDTGKPGFLE